MNNYFSITEFTAEPIITTEIAHKIIKYHMGPMNQVRYLFGKPIYVSQKSGFRSLETELVNGRSGDSEHCFQGKGAADYAADDLEGLGKALKDTPYTRICYYPHKRFYHCDYKAKERQLFVCEQGNQWVRKDW